MQTRIARARASLDWPVTLLIVVVSLFLLKELRHKAMIEDCLLASRNNCDTVVAMLTARPTRDSPASPIVLTAAPSVGSVPCDQQAPGD